MASSLSAQVTMRPCRPVAAQPDTMYVIGETRSGEVSICFWKERCVLIEAGATYT